MLGRRTGAVFRNADYIVDINLQDARNRGGDELSNSRRRRSRDVSIRDYDVDDDSVDQDYVAFILDLEEFVEGRDVHVHVHVDVDVDVDEGEYDPQYVKFLENLEVRGNSYMLCTSMKHGVHVPIMYEMEDDVCSKKVIKGRSLSFGYDEYAPKEREFVDKNNRRNVRFSEVNGMRNMRTRGESMKRKKSYSQVDDYVEELITLDSSEDSMSDYIVPRSFKRSAKAVDKNNCRNVRFSEVNGMRNMRTRGESMKRKKSYSQVDDYVEELITLDSSEDSMSDYIVPRSFKRSAKAVDEDIQEKRTVYEVVKPRKLRSHTMSDSQEKRTLNVDFPNFGAENPASKKRKMKPVSFDYSQEEPFVGGINESRSAPKTSPLEKNAINEVYKLFMDNFKANGDSCVYEYGDRKLVYYDLPNDTVPTTKADSSRQAVTVAAVSSDHLPSDWPLTVAADSSIQPINVAPISSAQVRREIVYGLPSNMSLSWKKGRYRPSTVHLPTQCQPTQPSTSIVVPTQCQPTQPSTSIVVPLDKQNLQVCHRVPSNMRKKLLVILNQPYNKEEHEQLWKEVNMRSAVHIHRDSRSGGSDRPGQMGRSLLDWNPDLASEIEKVKDNPPRVLNLLRMLSFYIKKIPCGRICKPWLDDTLTPIVPGSS